MKTEENYTNKIINNLKDYFKQNQIENYTNPSFEDKPIYKPLRYPFW